MTITTSGIAQTTRSTTHFAIWVSTNIVFIYSPWAVNDITISLRRSTLNGIAPSFALTPLSVWYRRENLIDALPSAIALPAYYTNTTKGWYQVMSYLTSAQLSFLCSLPSRQDCKAWYRFVWPKFMSSVIKLLRRSTPPHLPILPVKL